MKIRIHIRLLRIANTLCWALFGLIGAGTVEGLTQRAIAQTDLSLQAASQEASVEALRLLVFTASLQESVSKLVEVDQDLHNRFLFYRALVTTPPVAGAGLLISGRGSQTALDGISRLLNLPIWNRMDRSLAQSSENTIGLWKNLFPNPKTYVAIINSLTQMRRLLVFGSAFATVGSISVGSIGSSALSVWLWSQKDQELISHNEIREFLNYDQNIAQVLDYWIGQVAPILQMPPEAQVVLRSALVNAISAQAIEVRIHPGTVVPLEPLELIGSTKTPAGVPIMNPDVLEVAKKLLEVAKNSGEHSVNATLQAVSIAEVEQNIDLICANLAAIDRLASGGHPGGGREDPSSVQGLQEKAKLFQNEAQKILRKIDLILKD